MSERKSTVMAAARDKARKLKAERDVARAKVEKDIEEAVVAFHIAKADESAAMAAAEKARSDQGGQVAELSRLGLAESEIADLCELSVSGVRRSKRQSGTVRSSGDDSPLPAASAEPVAAAS